MRVRVVLPAVVVIRSDDVQIIKIETRSVLFFYVLRYMKISLFLSSSAEF